MHRLWLLGFCSLVALSCAQTFETITNSDYASCEIKSANRLTGNLQTAHTIGFWCRSQNTIHLVLAQ